MNQTLNKTIIHLLFYFVHPRHSKSQEKYPKCGYLYFIASADDGGGTEYRPGGATVVPRTLRNATIYNFYLFGNVYNAHVLVYHHE